MMAGVVGGGTAGGEAGGATAGGATAGGATAGGATAGGATAGGATAGGATAGGATAGGATAGGATAGGATAGGATAGGATAGGATAGGATAGGATAGGATAGGATAGGATAGGATAGGATAGGIAVDGGTADDDLREVLRLAEASPFFTMVNVRVRDAVITYRKPLVPNAAVEDSAGVFAQASSAGPAIFIVMDDATQASLGLVVGTRVSFTVTGVSRGFGHRIATADNFLVLGTGPQFSASGNTIDFSLTANAKAWESKLVTLSGSVASGGGVMSSGFIEYPVTTAGTTGAGLTVRMPNATALQASLVPGCIFSTNLVPVWRTSTSVTLSPFAASEVSASCPPSSLLGALPLGSTSLSVGFSRAMSPATLPPTAFTITGGNNPAVLSVTWNTPQEAHLTTTLLSRNVSYTITAASTATDLGGTLISPTARSATFLGPTPTSCQPPVVIGALFGASSATAAFNQDYVELHNRGTTTVSLAGMSLQYASATGTTWQVSPLSGSIPAGAFFLVGLSKTVGGTSLPTPDLEPSATLNLGSTAGKVALVMNATALTGACPLNPFIIDLVGYGASATCSESMPAPAPSATDEIQRGGLSLEPRCFDTNQNQLDFTVFEATPLNASFPPSPCTCQ